MTSSLSGEGSSLKVGPFSFGSPVSASAVSKTLFYINANEDKKNISMPMLSVSGKNIISFGSLATSASPKISGGGFTTYSSTSGSRGDCGQKIKGYDILTDPDNIGVEILVLSSVSVISNIGVPTVKALTSEPNEKEPNFNKEPSPGNDKVTVLDLIPPPNGDEDFDDIGGYTFEYAKEGILVGKTDFGSMLYESGFGAATEMGGFALSKVPEVSLAPEPF